MLVYRLGQRIPALPYRSDTILTDLNGFPVMPADRFADAYMNRHSIINIYFIASAKIFWAAEMPAPGVSLKP